MGRGQKFSRHELSFGETMGLEKPEARSLKKANKYSKHFHESETKNLSKRQTENFNYQRKKTVYQFCKSIEETVDPEFHTALNIATKRVYNRGLEYCRLQDAHLLENEIVQPNQALAYERYCKTLPKFTETKQIYEAQILKLNETISKVQKELEKKIKTCNKLKGDRPDQTDKTKKSATTSKKNKAEKTFRTKKT